jgi:DMSO/TMAO reductase YedYZ molybdopterin-dependent catalytic subunit
MTDPEYQEGEPASPQNVSTGVIISPDTLREERVPPGQARTRRYPVLDAFGPPQISLERWRLEVTGLVEQPQSWDWKEFRNLPSVRVFSDFHCVTRWSRLGNIWEGVATRWIAGRTGVSDKARFVVLHAFDNEWTTNLPIEHFLAEDSLLAWSHDGRPLSIEHGGPLRAIVPRLYAWKSAKWLKGVEFVREDRAGFWEQGGYHMLGDPWREQRFRWD